MLTKFINLQSYTKLKPLGNKACFNNFVRFQSSSAEISEESSVKSSFKCAQNNPVNNYFFMPSIFQLSKIII